MQHLALGFLQSSITTFLILQYATLIQPYKHLCNSSKGLFLQGKSEGFFFSFGATFEQKQFNDSCKFTEVIPVRFSTPQIPHNFSQKTLRSVTSHPRVLLTMFLLVLHVLKTPVFQGFSHYLEVTLSTHFLLM